MNGPRMRRGCSWGEQVEERGGIVFFFSFLFFFFLFLFLYLKGCKVLVLSWFGLLIYPWKRSLGKFTGKKEEKNKESSGSPD